MKQLNEKTLVKALAQVGIEGPEAIAKIKADLRVAQKERTEVLGPLFEAAAHAQTQACSPAALEGASNLWGALGEIGQAAIEHGYDAETVIVEVDTALGELPSKDARYQTVKNYRSQFKRTLRVMADAEKRNAVLPQISVMQEVTDGEGKKENRPVALVPDQVRFDEIAPALAREITRTAKDADTAQDVREFDTALSELTSALRACRKGQKENKEKGLVALYAAPHAQVLAAIHAMLKLVPERKAHSEPVKDTGAIANALAANAEGEADTTARAVNE